MTGKKPPTGCVVLLVENDHFTADDTAAALRSAGAVILGGPTSDGAMHVLDEFQPSYAVLDLNLDGQGPKFEIARHGASSSLELIVADLLSLA
jgi:ActR/RegA family two-component response regulator